ncbi:unnamed protein product [Prunus armeniaca]
MAESKSVPSNPAKKMRFTSSSEKDPSSATFDEVTKSTRGITMSRVVKRKIQNIKHMVEYNKSGRPHGKAAIGMHSYIGVLGTHQSPSCGQEMDSIAQGPEGVDFGSCSNGLCFCCRLPPKNRRILSLP